MAPENVAVAGHFRCGGIAVGRETKFGLLIGLVFIILFGVILSSRAGSAAPEHAVLPTGESQVHATSLETVNRTVDPFKADAALDMNGQGAAVQVRYEGPAEEPLPAPAALAPSDAGTVQADDRGTVAFGPVMVETPAIRSLLRPDPYGPVGAGDNRAQVHLARAEPPPDRGATVLLAAPSDSSRSYSAEAVASAAKAGPVYVVRSGDTIIGIARQFYGKDAPRLWKQIVDANKSAIRDPNRLAVGQKLVIPNVPQPPKSAAPRTDSPSGDTPGRTPLREPAPDTALANGSAPMSREAVREALRSMTVPADAGRPAARPGREAAATARNVSAEDLGRMNGSQSDLVEAPTPPLKTYTVQPGDTFNKIAAKLYGDGNKFGRLLALKNPGSDPSRLRIGQRIVLLDGVGTTASDSAVAMR